MKKTRSGRLLVSFGLAIVLLALVFVSLALLAPARHVSASPQAMAFPSHGEGLAGTAEATLQATGVPSISNIIGATYDEARGEVIVFGVADPDLPGMDFSYIRGNLVICLRAFYDSSGPEIPGVSIEGTEDPLDVIYFGTVTDTHFGQVSFESDRLLKIYTMGVDNLTGVSVTSNVTGYMSYPHRMQQLTETVADPIAVRYFFTPTLLVEPIATPHSIVFSQTQKFVDWAYTSAATSTATTEAAQGFVDNFNQYYWNYAAERRATNGDTTLYEMIQLAKLAAIAQWAYDQGLELKLPGVNDPWLSRYPVAFAATVTQTPGITVTWIQTVSGSPYEFGLQGGVYAIGQVVEIPPTEAGQQVVDIAFGGRHPSLPPPMMYAVPPDLVRPCDEPDTIGASCSRGSCGPLAAYVIPLADNAVANGDFEDGPGSAPWSQDSAVEMIWAGSPHNGTYSALFPVYHNAQVAMFQTLYIPGDATMARLTYWRAATTDETTHPHDFFAAFLADANGSPLTTLETLDDGDADGYWRQVSFDVAAYAGQTVQLWFTATTDAANITNFHVDDVSLDYLDLAPPTVTTAHAPDQVTQTETVEFEAVFHERMKTAVMPTVTLAFQGAPTSLALTGIQGTQTTYTLTARAGTGYTNGYLDSDPTQWHGVFTFSPQMAEGTYVFDVSAAQDIAGNVMYPAQSVYTLTLRSTLSNTVYLPLVVKSLVLK
jgi:hypothetical protein